MSQFVGVLRQGYIPTDTGGAILELTKRYCENELNRQTRRLRETLEQYGNNPETITISCVRYSRSCSELLFFKSIEGMPQEPAEQMAGEIRRFVRHVLEAVARSATFSHDDVVYCIQRLERRWRDDE